MLKVVSKGNAGRSSNATVKGVCCLRRALLTLVKCMGWVRKKWWRLSRPMLLRTVNGRCDPKRTCNNSDVERCNNSSLGMMARSRPRRSRVVMPILLFTGCDEKRELTWSRRHITLFLAQCGAFLYKRRQDICQLLCWPG